MKNEIYDLLFYGVLYLIVAFTTSPIQAIQLGVLMVVLFLIEIKWVLKDD